MGEDGEAAEYIWYGDAGFVLNISGNFGVRNAVYSF